MPRLLGLLAAFAAASLLALTAGQALASHIQCGEVITQDTTLDSDLTDCPGDGLIIGANNITLNLSGHTIDGLGVLAPAVTYGVDNRRGYDGVTIRDGVIRDFASAVEMGDASHNVIRELSLTGSGIFIYSSSDDNLIEKNSVWDASWGIATSDSTGNVIRHNTLRDNAGGISVGGGSFNEIRGNSISRSATGIAVKDAPDNALIRNFVFDNGVGIEAIDSAYRTRVERNFAYANSEDGIQVECCQSLVLRNVANANGDDGIHVAYGGIDEFGPDQVIGNTANYNGDLGIEALGAGVVDGGGNRAFGNGNPLQCLNVSCKPNGKPKR